MQTENHTTKEPGDQQPAGKGLDGAACSPKIFRVEVSYEIYVVAESKNEALMYAKDAVDDEEPEMEHATEIKEISEIPKDWRDALPYGKRELIKHDRTIRDFMENSKLSPPDLE